MNTKFLPLVSIITPVYNQADYLELTMLSVIGQDYPAIEYIVIDDGSKDNSLEIAKGIEKKYPGRVKVITQPNSGQALTLNRGWSQSKGEILTYLSSDDCLMPQAVSQMVAVLLADPKLSVAYCDYWLIDAHGRHLRQIYTEEFSAKRLRVDLICQPGPGAFFRRSVFEQEGGWCPELRQVPDFEFWLRAERHGKFERVKQTLAEYRIHAGSASFSQMSTDRSDEIIDVVKNYWNKYPNFDESKRSLANANVLAAKNHAQSGRIKIAMQRMSEAFKIDSKLIYSKIIWRYFISGVLRRYIYIVVEKIRKIRSH